MSKQKISVVSGATGQDASYLMELLLKNDHKVYGVIRRSSTTNTQRIDHILNDIEIIEADLLDSGAIHNMVNVIKPDEFYNLAAQSHVGLSFKIPELTFKVNAGAVASILEAIHQHSPTTHFYQASTSELFGNSTMFPQHEGTLFHPESPYAVAKLAAHHMVRVYRYSYNIFACSGILFNHESPRRGDDFVTQKIAKAAVRIYLGKQKKVYLGNIDAQRDWGHAKDYVRAMHMMLQTKSPKDYVIATGETRSVRDFLVEAFGYFNMDYLKYYEVNPEFYRPNDVHILQGDWSKALRELGWRPEISFKELVYDMVESALKSEK